MRDMNTVFASLVPSGWTLSEATGIDNNGNIVGYMTNSANISLTEGFLISAHVARRRQRGWQSRYQRSHGCAGD